MTIYYNATDHKPLVKAISEFTGAKAVYLKPPTYAYQIDYFTVTREGNLVFDDMADSEEIENLIEALAQQGFIAECSEYDSEQPAPEMGEEPLEDTPPACGEPTGLVITIPFDKLSLGNLTNLLDAKGSLIKKALGIEATPLHMNENSASFPWFNSIPAHDELIATCMKENDITEFTISSTFSSLIATLAGFEKQGYRMTGLTEVNANYTDWQTNERARVPAIRLVRM